MQYPWMAGLGVLDRIEDHMRFLNVEDEATNLGGDNWLYATPDDRSPVLFVYFTYKRTQPANEIVLRAVHAVP